MLIHYNRRKLSVLLAMVAVFHVCESGTNLDSHFKATIAERPDFVSTITVSNGGPWGKWKKTVYCPVDTFAAAYAMKVHGVEHIKKFKSIMALDNEVTHLIWYEDPPS